MDLHLKFVDLHRQRDSELNQDHAGRGVWLAGEMIPLRFLCCQQKFHPTAAMEDHPLLLTIEFRGATKIVATQANIAYEELEDLVNALFLSAEDCAAGTRPLGLLLNADYFVTLRAACENLPVIASFGEVFQLLVSFPGVEDDNEPGTAVCLRPDSRGRFCSDCLFFKL